MGKYFEIVYSPEQFDANTNSDQGIPWGGINTRAPANLIHPRYFPSVDDFTVHNRTLQTRPVFQPTFLDGPATSVGNTLVGLAPGFNPTGSGNNLIAFVAGANVGTYFLDNANVWHLINAAPAWQPRVPVEWRIFAGTLFAVQSGVSRLASWDGVNAGSWNANSAVAGGVNLGASFIDELDNHILMADTFEGAGPTEQGQRIRWSANGLPLVWDTAVNINAGFNDFLEVADRITGTMMLGRTGYLFRTDGITEMAPTGNGIAPFDFNHFWASRLGIGSVFPYSHSQYGPFGFFVARDEVYQLSSAGGIQKIGGAARDAIMSDIVDSDVSNTPVVGFATPYLFSHLTGQPVANSNYPFPTYMLGFRSAVCQGVRFWVYHAEEQNWTRFNIPGFIMFGRPILNNTLGGVSGNTLMLVPLTPNPASGDLQIGAFSTASFNTEVNAQITFRSEDIQNDRVPTVRRVVLDYNDLGSAAITVTLTAVNDNNQVITTSVPITLGNAIATNQVLTEFVDITLTGFRPQLSIQYAAQSGPVSIVRATMVGEYEEVTL